MPRLPLARPASLRGSGIAPTWSSTGGEAPSCRSGHRIAPSRPEEDVQALAAMIALREAADADNVRTLYAAMVKLLSAGPRH